MCVIQVYEPSKGVLLKHSGLRFIRAVAVVNGCTNSDVFTSGWVHTLANAGLLVNTPHQVMMYDLGQILQA